MQIEFQKDILRYLVQVKEAKKFLKVIDKEIFDLPEDKAAFDALKSYQEKYSSIAGKNNLIQYFSSEALAMKVKQEVVDMVVYAIDSMYKPLDGETAHLRSHIIREVQEKKCKELLKRAAGNIKQKNVFDQLRAEIVNLINLGSNDETPPGVSILKDVGTSRLKFVEGYPSKFSDMNDIMTSKGFKRPEIIVLMAGPKSGKTTLMVNLAVSSMQDGRKVLYLDTENGVDRIKKMSYQNMTGLTFDELISGEFDELIKEQVRKYSFMGGEMRIESIPPRRWSTDDVEDLLDRLRDEEGFVPDEVYCDYFDNMIPAKKSGTERRLNLQEVYFDWKAVATKRGFPVFTPSQVNRDAVGKPVFNVKDIGEDFGKVANCDSLWAYCRTEDEKAEGLARLVIVANRDGKDYGTVYLKVNSETCTIEQKSIRKAVA